MKGIRSVGILFLTYFIVSSNANSDKPEAKLTDINKECSSVADKFSALNIGHASLAPDSKIHDGEMEICYKGSKELDKTSCCTRKMERKYHVSATKDFSDTVKQSSFYLKNMLQQQGSGFQEQFLKLIQQAENKTLEIFNEDFSIPVQDRRGPLDNFFMDLNAYVKQREVDIHDTVSTLFNEIFPPVVQYLLIDSSKYELDDDYRDCLMGFRQSLNPRPFGDIPNKMAVDLTRSLGLARLYLEAVSVGVEAINTTDHLPLDLQCSRAVTRLTYCAHCDGNVEVRPCKGYCQNVMRGCMAAITQLDVGWNEYVDSLEILTSGMKNTLDIGEVMGRLHSQISEGIMHAMHSAHQYYSKMITRCGQPKSIHGEAPIAPSLPSVLPTKKPLSPLNTPTPKDQELFKQMESFMSSMLTSKGFYNTLADAVCTAERFSARAEEPCWNGRAVGTYAEEVPKANFEMQAKNPEIKVSNVKPQTLVSLADKLAHIKKKLNKKSPLSGVGGEEMMQGDRGYKEEYSGYGNGGTNTVDDEDYSMDYSGSGSGDGGNIKKNPPYKTPNRGGSQGAADDDMYLVDTEKDKNNQPYITHTPSSQDSTGTASRNVFTLALTSILLSLYMWING